jgi:tetratricopeptide (TPR) repeat protein
LRVKLDTLLRHAQQSIELDPQDAMGHWTLGRAQFLAGEQDQAIQSVSSSLAVNPNFAQGHYALGFIRAHAGMAVQALPALATAERLSPYDPLLFAIESARALSLAIEGKRDEAAVWAIRATSEPNAHFHIQAIAAACLVLANRHDEARGYAKRACNAHPGYSIRVFNRCFPQKCAAHRDLVVQALRSAGVPDDDDG